ncbi:sulfotransferase family protein [Nocardioides sp.]|uniref:sulfotransferase family protein n=1 Tax=Nocardioides sp. TaxID=35761 RepID=UPI002C887511|nr:sulfotransferase family protein [Nocardioides sp.]HSX66363.1 sulfotransferase family protein [Nocardioides sp.]
MSSRRIVLVAGSGRSGTSTVVGLLRLLGVRVPQPEVVADASNPKGFGEPQWVVDFHDELLEEGLVQVADSRPVAWELAARVAAAPAVLERAAEWLEQQFAVADELVVKDPRLTWFNELWLRAAAKAGAEPVFITMLRPPPEVVRSRQANYNGRMADAFGVAQWVNLMIGTERATRGHTRAFVAYADLIAGWQAALLPLAEHLGVEALRNPGPEALAEGDAFVDPSLRRMQPGWDDLAVPADLRALAEDLWRELEALAIPGRDDAEAHARLDAIAARHADLFAGAESVVRSSIVAARRKGERAVRATAAAPARRRWFNRG